MTPEFMHQVLTAQQARLAVAVITHIATGAQRLVTQLAAPEDDLAEILEAAFRFDRSGVHIAPEGEIFVTIHNPPKRLIIIGAVQIAQSIIPIAEMAGYDITVIDPRGAFATGARFPSIDLQVQWPDEVLPKLQLDARTAFIAVTHDPKIDDPALQLALRSDVFYIGALGSKKTQAARRERLIAQGFSEQQLSRIHGPIGLPIGAVGSVEIAISILAEMTRCLRVGA